MAQSVVIRSTGRRSSAPPSSDQSRVLIASAHRLSHSSRDSQLSTPIYSVSCLADSIPIHSQWYPRSCLCGHGQQHFLHDACIPITGVVSCVVNGIVGIYRNAYANASTAIAFFPWPFSLSHRRHSSSASQSICHRERYGPP
ncbi:hypothetical protein SCLCIDRAFT_1223335 [Scleroderma citrinum Foug A]|uniref:Uncharacterized protein n=1 Tax=Scleroderma citrinum Foug A TaxID=1036808 RepID=A0A0C3D9Z9_9AGAM|nr:hypothetical protein SCLCIDRAFT_1223335 [Scleroderma citrinum Foug A]